MAYRCSILCGSISGHNSKLSSYIYVPLGLEAAYRSRLKTLYLCKSAGLPHLAKKISLITYLVYSSK
ncbi:hypothetical protein J6590_004580 [Homalodisca vitripennis]|nr:hypothetical protein J6590_004580 [Homalodisca vitripennis]